MDLDYDKFLELFECVQYAVLTCKREISNKKFELHVEQTSRDLLGTPKYIYLPTDEEVISYIKTPTYLVFLREDGERNNNTYAYVNDAQKFFHSSDLDDPISTVIGGARGPSRSPHVKCRPIDEYNEELFFQKSLLDLASREEFLAEALTAFCCHAKLPPFNISLNLLPKLVRHLNEKEVQIYGTEPKCFRDSLAFWGFVERVSTEGSKRT